MRATSRAKRSAGHPAAFEFALALGDEPRRRGLDVVLQALRKVDSVEAGSDRIKHLDDDRAGVAAERAARPEQPRIERDRNASRPSLGIQVRDPELVAR